MKKYKKALAAIMLMITAIFATGCTPEDDPNNGGGSEGDGGEIVHEYVDLGLPSGTLWATSNVRISAPGIYGDWFAWGETEPKTTYLWSTYQYADTVPSYSHYRLTKYCNNASYGYNGYTDSLTVLQPSDDAATVNWGSDWCIPTVDQWRELIANTSPEWTTQNGVKGRLLTASNGNSLFLPASGLYCGDAYIDVGSHGYYWSSSLDTVNPKRAWYYYSGAPNAGTGGMINYFDRSRGRSVRPVRSSR